MSIRAAWGPSRGSGTAGPDMRTWRTSRLRAVTATVVAALVLPAGLAVALPGEEVGAPAEPCPEDAGAADAATPEPVATPTPTPRSGKNNNRNKNKVDDAPPEEPCVVGAVELEALEAARALVAERTAATLITEAERRLAETALVDANRELLREERDLRRVSTTLTKAEDRSAAARTARHDAQEQFDLTVATSYKFGGVSAALAMDAISSASDSHDLARTLGMLDGVLGHSYEELGRRITALDEARQRVESLGRLRDVIARATSDLRQAVAPAVQRADTARTEAWNAEAGLLDAAGAALAAQQTALDAGADPAAIRDVAAGVQPGLPLIAVADPPDAANIAARRGWLDNRREALAEESGLPPGAWTLRRGMACPVDGASFVNDFHFPRSHGRRHLGTDVFAPRGTPIRAMADGVVSKLDPVDTFRGANDLGGITVSVTTRVGRFYAGHLSRIPAGLAAGDRVEAGQVIGYVGTSGNARGTPPHLHLGWYVQDVGVNPWPTLAVVCDPADRG